MRVPISPTSNSVLALVLACVLAASMSVLQAAGQSTGDSQQPQSSASTQSHKSKKPAKPPKKSKKAKGRAARAADAARTALLKRAFVASTELRPMAQQLGTMRTPAAYAGVTAYAHQHNGEAAAAAYLALGHAYILDKRFAEALASLRLARQAGQELADYADFLAAKANREAGNNAAAAALLNGFANRYPDSIFDAEAPELEANALLAMGDANGAQRVLTAAAGSASTNRAGYLLCQGQVAVALGQTQEAVRDFKHLLLSHPLSQEAEIALAKLKSMGAESSLSATELRSLGDAYYNGGRYSEASEQYHALAKDRSLDAGFRNGFAVAAAACDLKLKRLTTAQAEALADTGDENGARRLYLLNELARNRNDLGEQQRIVSRMESDFPPEPLAGGGSLFQRQHVSLAARVCDGSELLYLSFDPFSGEHERGNRALAGRLAQLPARTLFRRGAALRRADTALSQLQGGCVCTLLARTAL